MVVGWLVGRWLAGGWWLVGRWLVVAGQACTTAHQQGGGARRETREQGAITLSSAPRLAFKTLLILSGVLPVPSTASSRHDTLLVTSNG